MTASGMQFARAMQRLAKRTAPLRLKKRKHKIVESEPFVGPSVIPGRGRRRKSRSLTFRELLEYLFWTAVVYSGWLLWNHAVWGTSF